MHRLNRYLLLVFPGALWLLVFFFFPLVLVFAISFLTRSVSGMPTLPITLEAYDRSFRLFSEVILQSVYIAALTTIICLVLGYPTAYFIRTRRLKLTRQFALLLVVLPFWTNFLVRIYAWQFLLVREGLTNNLLISLGIVGEPVQFLNTEFAVFVGLSYAYLPFMILPLYASMSQFDFKYFEAAEDLGANRWQQLWRVLIPMTMPGIIGGCVLVFVPSVGSFVVPDILGGTEGLMIGNLIEAQYLGIGNLPLGAALSVILMIPVMITLVVYMRLER